VSGALSLGILVKKVRAAKIDNPHQRAAVLPVGQKTEDRNQVWLYETSLGGDYHVHFKNGCVAQNGHHADWAGGQE
jgi:hypothetical protein